ncbi:MAG: beta-propeller fold lactonase family protein [Erysipelotrichaceae bacterium]
MSIKDKGILIMKKQIGYISACSKQDYGIYEYTISEDGLLSKPFLKIPLYQSKYLSLKDDILVSTVKEEAKAGIFTFNLNNKDSHSLLLNEIPTCFIKQDENRIYSANYHEGNIMIYEKLEDHIDFIKKIDVKDKAGCHQIIFYKEYFLVPCLFLDQILIFHKEDNCFIKAINFPKGSGPRHGVFNKDMTIFYVLSELSNEIFKFEVNHLDFVLIEQLSLIEKDVDGEGAVIILTEDEKYLYISIRSVDEIIVVSLNHKMQVIQRKSCGGKHPRDFIYAAKQHCLIIANRYSNLIVSIRVNDKTGLLENQLSEQFVPEPLCVILGKEEENE